MAAEWITYKVKTCNCGCGGKDPWHKRRYRRVVWKVSETQGFVKLPFSDYRVRVTRVLLGGNSYSTWRVDRDSIVFKKRRLW